MKLKKILQNSIMETVFYIFIAIVGLLKVKYIIMGLGSEMNGYFQFINNIVSYIILAESGISTAILFKMYKPIADGDKEKVSMLFNGSRKILKVIGFIFIGLSIIALPFIYLYTKTWDLFILIGFCFIMLIFAIAFPYIFGTRSYTTILTADQNRFTYGLIYNISRLVSDILIIIFVINTNSLISIVIINLIFKILETIVIRSYCKKKYSWLDKSLPADTSAKTMSKDTLYHQVGYVIFNNVDVVLIMSFFGPLMVSIYSSYNYIVNFIRELIEKNNQIISNIFGYSFAKNDDKTYSYYNSYISTFSVLSLIIAICFTLGARSFINLWIQNPEYILNFEFVYCFALIILLNIALINVNSVFQANGLFKESKYFPIIESLTNIILSIIFLYIFGITGVLLATVASCLIGLFIRTKLLQKAVFKDYSYISFLKRPLLTILFFILNIFLLKIIEEKFLLIVNNYIIWFLVMFATFIIVTVIVLVIYYLFDDSMKFNFAIIKDKIKRRK